MGLLLLGFGAGDRGVQWNRLLVTVILGTIIILWFIVYSFLALSVVLENSRHRVSKFLISCKLNNNVVELVKYSI